MAVKRMPGFYWVLFEKHWTVAELTVDANGLESWSRSGSDARLTEAAFEEIGFRLAPPFRPSAR
jgi:hypothetical protein